MLVGLIKFAKLNFSLKIGPVAQRHVLLHAVCYRINSGVEFRAIGQRVADHKVVAEQTRVRCQREPAGDVWKNTKDCLFCAGQCKLVKDSLLRVSAQLGEISKSGTQLSNESTL